MQFTKLTIGTLNIIGLTCVQHIIDELTNRLVTITVTDTWLTTLFSRCSVPLSSTTRAPIPSRLCASTCEVKFRHLVVLSEFPVV